jgi:hypothetical protein
MSFTRSTRFAITLLLFVFVSLSGRAQISLAMFISTDASGLTLTGSGTSNVTMSIGTIQAYGGTVPTGVTRSVNSPTNWTVATPFDVGVLGLGIIVPSYTLTAQLQHSDAVNSWKINSLDISSGSITTITTSAIYNLNFAYTFSLTIPFSESAGAISNTITLTAIGN